MNFADSSWSMVITDPKSVIAVGRISAVEKLGPANSNQMTGQATIHIEQELTPHRWLGSRDVRVVYSQWMGEALRLREGNAGWNGVDVRPGTILLIGMKARGSPNGPLGLETVRQITSINDPQIGGVEQALAVEAETDPEKRKRLLMEALNSQDPILMGYVHYALGRMQRIPRADAAMLEMKVLLDAARSSRQRLSAESTLELELWASRAPDDEINRNIVKVFLHVVSQNSSEMQSTITMALYRLLISAAPPEPDAAHMYRSRLLHGIDAAGIRAAALAIREEESNPSIQTQAAQLFSVFSGMLQ